MLQSMGSQTVRHDLVTELHDDICSLHGRKEFRYIAVVHFKGFCYASIFYIIFLYIFLYIWEYWVAFFHQFLGRSCWHDFNYRGVLLILILFFNNIF